MLALIELINWNKLPSFKRCLHPNCIPLQFPYSVKLVIEGGAWSYGTVCTKLHESQSQLSNFQWSTPNNVSCLWFLQQCCFTNGFTERELAEEQASRNCSCCIHYGFDSYWPKTLQSFSLVEYFRILLLDLNTPKVFPLPIRIHLPC